MTLLHQQDEHLARNKYRCDVCGKVDFWDPETWSWFGSIMDAEGLEREEIPTMCSEDCRLIFDARMKAGVVTVRRAKPKGYGYRITGERKGY